MSVIGNVFRYPVAVLIPEGVRADSKELDKAHKEFHEEVNNPIALNKIVLDIKKGLPESLEFAAKPIANTLVFVGKRSLLELGGGIGAVFGGLGFAYGSTPGSWLREKLQSTSNYIYEKIKPVFHWGGAALGTLGVLSLGSGYLLKKSPNSAPQKDSEE